MVIFLMFGIFVVNCHKLESNESPTFKVIHNPGYNKNDTELNDTKLIQVIIGHSNKSIHFCMPGNGVGAPLSIVMMESEGKPSPLQVDYKSFLYGNGTNIWNSITLKNKRTSYGVIFNQFCIYEDAQDDAQISESEIIHKCKHMLGKNFFWSLKDQSINSNQLNFVYTSRNSTDSEDNFEEITVNISIPRSDSEIPNKGLFSLIPGLGISFEITIENVSTPVNGRIAVILLPFSEDHMVVEEDFAQSLTFSEIKPNTLFNLHLSQRQRLEENGLSKATERLKLFGHTPAFMQWTTHCEASRDGAEIRDAHSSSRIHVTPHLASKYSHSIPYAIYGDLFNQNSRDNSVGLRIQAVSLGSPHDGYFSSTKFLRWRGILSMGEPQSGSPEGLRRLLGGLLAGISMLVAFSAVIAGFAIYRRRQRNTDPEQAPLIGENNGASRPRMLLSCKNGRLTICRRIPSPHLSQSEDVQPTNV